MIKLYWNRICPFVQRAWITALEKNVPIELVHVPLNEIPEWYAKINPRQTVPAIMLPDGHIILESMFVAKYFDEAFEPKNVLMTEDPALRLKIDLFIDQLGSLIGSLYGLLTSSPDEEAAAKTNTIEQLEIVEKNLEKSSHGPFFLGDRFTMADVAIIPFLDRFRYTLYAYRGFNIFEYAPRLKKLLRAAQTRSSVAITSCKSYEYVDAYTSYGGSLRHPLKWKLYTKPNCPFCIRVKLFLTLLGAPATTYVKVVEVDTTDPNAPKVPSFPSLQLPGDHIYSESILLMDYLADEFGASADSRPNDPVKRADGRLFTDIIGNFMEFVMKKAFNEPDFAQLVQQAEALIKQGPFLFGATPSIYDCIVLPMLRGVALDPVGVTKLGAKLQALFTAAQKNAALGAILQGSQSK